MNRKLKLLFSCLIIYLVIFIAQSIFLLYKQSFEKYYQRIEIRMVEETHPLENSCKYAVLNPFEKNIIEAFKVNPWNFNTCNPVLPNFVSFKDNILFIDQEKAKDEFNNTVICQYRPIAGTLKPHRTKVVPVGNWKVVKDKSSPIYDEQFEVVCFVNDNSTKNKTAIYKYAYAQVPPKLKDTFRMNTEDLLSVSIICLDSTSRNAFRRHMPKTLNYFTKYMNALYLNGYMKVADNTHVNLLPLFTGLRYGNQSPDMPSDYPMGKHLVVEDLPLIWNDYRDKNCATFLNDDAGDYRAGLFQYHVASGMTKKPTTYWYQPWHVYHRLLQLNTTNVSRFCFGNEFYYDLQLDLAEQMMKLYNNTCYFAFTSVDELPHDDSSYLELLDKKLKNFLQRLFTRNSLNKTILIIMGDHGQRISATQYTFIGRIEERMPLFGIHFPQWFRKKYPQLIKNFRQNKNRLTSHFDIYQVLKDIAEGNFNKQKNGTEGKVRKTRGISLLHHLMPNTRSCKEANVPEQHCACLIPDIDSVSKDDRLLMHNVILEYTNEKLEKYSLCKSVDKINIKKIEKLTMSQMVQHGVREQDNSSFGLSLLKRGRKIGIIEYYEIEYVMYPINVLALIRLQKDNKYKTITVNVDPLVKKVSKTCRYYNTNVAPRFCC